MSTGLNARRATGFTGAESKEKCTRTESVARWSPKGRAAYEAERKALLFLFLLFSSGARCSNQAEYYFMRGRGFCFLPNFLRFYFHCFRGAATVPCCAFSFVQPYIQQAYQKRKRITLPRVCTYVRHVSERRGRRTSGNRPRREAYVASELFSPEAWRQDSWHYQVASLQLTTIDLEKNVFNHGPLSAWYSNLLYFSFLSERSGRRRPPVERSASYYVPGTI